MPIAYPANQITKEARARAGGGFESAIEVAPVNGQTAWGNYVEISQPAATIFSDDFSSGDLSHTENGAGWEGQRATTIVNSDGCLIFNTAGTAENPPWCGFEDRQWEGLTNNNALRFRYGVDDEFPMQTWGFGQPADRVRDAWFRLPMRVPKNYEHINNSGSSTNNKFFAVFMDGRETFSDGGATVVFQTYDRPQDETNVGSSLDVYVFNSQSHPGRVAIYDDFWSVPATEGGVDRDDRLRWFDLVLRVKANTSGQGSGEIQAWRKWQDESWYEALIDAKNVDIPLPNSGYDGWNTVQIIGGDNSWLAAGTEILQDGFYVSENPLVPAGTEGL